MLVFDLYKLGFKVNDHQIQNIKLKCYIKQGFYWVPMDTYWKALHIPY